jgi:hypothetical protein
MEARHDDDQDPMLLEIEVAVRSEHRSRDDHRLAGEHGQHGIARAYCGEQQIGPR